MRRRPRAESAATDAVAGYAAAGPAAEARTAASLFLADLVVGGAEASQLRFGSRKPLGHGGDKCDLTLPSIRHRSPLQFGELRISRLILDLRLLIDQLVTELAFPMLHSIAARPERDRAVGANDHSAGTVRSAIRPA